MGREERDDDGDLSRSRPFWSVSAQEKAFLTQSGTRSVVVFLLYYWEAIKHGMYPISYNKDMWRIPYCIRPLLEHKIEKRTIIINLDSSVNLPFVLSFY